MKTGETVCISGEPDVYTGVNLPVEIKTRDDLRCVRTVEELKLPIRYLRCDARQPKDQCLFEAAVLSELTQNPIHLSCLTDMFSIRITCVRRLNDRRVHYLAPSACDARTYVVYQLLLHLFSDDDICSCLERQEELLQRDRSVDGKTPEGTTHEYYDSCEEEGDGTT
jgi:hypothetical protein